MLARLYSALFFAGVVFILGGTAAIVANLIGPWFPPLVIASLVVGIVVFIFDTVVAWLSPE